MNIRPNIRELDEARKDPQQVFIPSGPPTLVTGTGAFLPMETIRQLVEGKEFLVTVLAWLKEFDLAERERELAEQEAERALVEIDRGECVPVVSEELESFLAARRPK